jgi:hypothetical protein
MRCLQETTRLAKIIGVEGCFNLIHFRSGPYEMDVRTIHSSHYKRPWPWKRFRGRIIEELNACENIVTGNAPAREMLELAAAGGDKPMEIIKPGQTVGVGRKKE